MQLTKWKKTADIYPLHDIRVIDGDTIEARIALPFEQSVRKRIRLKGWWADECTGPYAAQGMAAKLALDQFLAFRVVWLLAPSCRMDKYGRVIGHIMVQHQIVNPVDVLGKLQLTEKVHKEHRDLLAKSAAVGPVEAWPCACGPEGTHQGLETCPALPSPLAQTPALQGPSTPAR